MASIKTEGKVHINEDLENTIYMVENEKTPFTALLSREKAETTKHEWLIEELNPVDTDNALAEGAEFTDTAVTVPERVDNYTQIFRKVMNVSGTMRAVKNVGGEELARQIVKAGKELKRDIEATLLSAQAKNSGSGGVARRLQGAEAFITTNVTDLASVAMTEGDFRAAMQEIFVAGGDLKKVIVSPTTKTAISNTFDGASQKQQDAAKKTVHNATDIYVGDFGTVDIIPSLYVTSTSLLFVDPDKWALAVLRKMKTEDLAKTADSDRKALVTELTLVSKNEKGNGKITNAA